MIVAFPYSYCGWERKKDLRDIVNTFARVFKQQWPNDKLVQATDAKTCEVKGVDECVRLDVEPFGIWYFSAWINFPYDEYLRIDDDVVVRADVSEVWDEKFDIAIADERGSKSHNKFRMTTMNGGVVFVRNRDFFRESLKHYKEETGMDNWQDLQIAMQMTINAGNFLVHRLDPMVYNYYPENDRTPHPALPKIIHYKGKRKSRMVRDYKQLLEAV